VNKINDLKKLLPFVLLFFTATINAQKINAIYVNLYTDSLKKGTHNYINIDGQLANGKYIPLDSTKILFTCTEAKFSGNSIVIPANVDYEKVKIKASLKSDSSIYKEFEVYIKKMEDPPLQPLSSINNTATTTKSKKKRNKK
jgi:hypothetical protein